jgi:hypothetical protein
VTGAEGNQEFFLRAWNGFDDPQTRLSENGGKIFP